MPRVLPFATLSQSHRDDLRRLGVDLGDAAPVPAAGYVGGVDAVVDGVLAVTSAIQRLERAWGRCPPATRATISRLVCLNGDGSVTVYRLQEAP